MYLKDFVVTLEVKGQTCREFKNEQGRNLIYIPFGSDYSLQFRNMRNVRALVEVKIDGAEVTAGGLVIGANSSSSLTGKIDGDSTKNQFRFIRKTERIKNVRGDKPMDSVVEVKVTFEEDWYELKRRLDNADIWRKKSIKSCGITWQSDRTESPLRSFSSYNQADSGLSSLNQIGFNCSANIEGGLTVPGTPTNVNYSTTSFRRSSDVTSVSFFLTGTNPESLPIAQPVVTRSERICPTCRFRNPNTDRWCGDCGTCLV